MTKQRSLILSLIRASHRHMTAAQIFEQAREVMPEMVQATVYNNLNALVASGDIIRIPVANGPDRFDKTVSPHYHMVCDRCGQVDDLSCADILPMLERANHKSILSLDLMAHYLCDPCRKATQE